MGEKAFRDVVCSLLVIGPEDELQPVNESAFLVEASIVWKQRDTRTGYGGDKRGRGIGFRRDENTYHIIL